MKKIIAIIIVAAVAWFAFGQCPSQTAATSSLSPAWQSPTEFKQPESVVYDAARQTLYVSNVAGTPDTANGSGFISQLSLAGNITKLHWIDGLNAPKGMKIVGDSLYVADINQLVVIDLNTAAISTRYDTSNAVFLNDVTADVAGNVYVSDMATNEIYQLADNQFSVWLKDDALESPNGLLVEGEQLIVGSWGVMSEGFATKIAGHLKTVSLTDKSIRSLGNGTPVGNIDGVEPAPNGNYFATDWMNGTLHLITPQGDATTLLTLSQGAADLAVVDGLVIIPMMMDNLVLAYRAGT